MRASLLSTHLEIPQQTATLMGGNLITMKATVKRVSKKDKERMRVFMQTQPLPRKIKVKK